MRKPSIRTIFIGTDFPQLSYEKKKTRKSQERYQLRKMIFNSHLFEILIYLYISSFL